MPLLPYLRLFPYLIDIPAWIYFTLMLGCGVWIYARSSGKLFVNFWSLAFCLICILSSAVNGIPVNGWSRLCCFLLLMLVFGPLTGNAYIARQRKNILKWCSRLSVGVSLTVIITCLMPMNNEESHFGLLPSDAMTIAPIASLAFVWGVAVSNLDGMKNILVALVSAAIATFALILLSSRIAIAAAIVGGIAIIIFSRSGKSKKFFPIYVFMFVMAISCIFPLTPEMHRKLNYADEKGSYLASREQLWDNRRMEIYESPLYGKGFRQITHGSSDFDYFASNASNGKEEAGSSWLYLCSSLGIIGLGCFLAIWTKGMWSSVKRKDLFTTGALAMFGVHLIAEGYIMAAGAPLCLILWLTISCGLGNKPIIQTRKKIAIA